MMLSLRGRSFASVGVAVFSLCALISACGGSSGGSSPAPAPQAAAAACPLYVVAKSLVYPAPGATAISDSTGVVIVAGPIRKVLLQPTLGTPLSATTPLPVPSPLPVPNASPLAQPLDAFALPTLAQGTTYTVYAQDTAVLPNCPEGSPVQVGSFTTR